MLKIYGYIETSMIEYCMDNMIETPSILIIPYTKEKLEILDRILNK
jgi:hypothetical protein